MMGCLVRLALLPVIIGVTYTLLSLRQPFPSFVFPAPGAEVAAPIAGFFFWFAALYLLDLRQARANRTLAHASLGRALRDGDEAVVYGTIAARGPLLEAPFSGKSCVGYHYRVHHRGSQGRADQIDYEGFALTPSEVRGPMGSVAILAPSNKELFYELPFRPLRDDAYDRAERYLKSVDFGDPGGLFGDVSRREIVEGAGSFRSDVKSGTDRPVRSCTLDEKLVEPGAEVSIAGIYSAAGKGIAPHPNDIFKPFHIVPGGEASLDRKIRGKMRGAAISALLGLATIGVYAVMVARGLT